MDTTSPSNSTRIRKLDAGLNQSVCATIQKIISLFCNVFYLKLRVFRKLLTTVKCRKLSYLGHFFKENGYRNLQHIMAEQRSAGA